MKRTKLLRVGMLAIAFATAALGGVSARASLITLDVSATLIPTTGNAACSPTCTLGGDLVINNSPPAPGMFLSADVTATGFSPAPGSPFDLAVSQVLETATGLTELLLEAVQLDGLAPLSLIFSTPTPGSLVGYTGGLLSMDSSLSIMHQGFWAWNVTSGSLTPAAAVSEPPSGWLVLSALAGLGGLLCKRLLLA
jgi:hypothetical protein